MNVHLFYLEVTVLEVAQPECLLAVVERQHGLHPVHKLLQAFLQSGNMVREARVLADLAEKHSNTVSPTDLNNNILSNLLIHKTYLHYKKLQSTNFKWAG